MKSELPRAGGCWEIIGNSCNQLFGFGYSGCALDDIIGGVKGLTKCPR
jgi:hypothetical protein